MTNRESKYVSFNENNENEAYLYFLFAKKLFPYYFSYQHHKEDYICDFIVNSLFMINITRISIR